MEMGFAGVKMVNMNESEEEGNELPLNYMCVSDSIYMGDKLA